MGKFINESEQDSNIGKGSVISIKASKQMIKDVVTKVTIPMYFYNVIVPQLGSYYDLYPVNFDSKVTVCCPLHDEDTPSCRYYEETNSFYCFGCQKGGDVVSLHRYYAERMNGTKPEYDEAVSFLYDYFIKGKESETFVKSNVVVKEKLNTDADLVKLNYYRVNLEKSITYDKNISFEAKKLLWDVLDSVDCLISKDRVSAVEAEKYIRDKVKEIINLETTSQGCNKLVYKGAMENACN